MTGLRDPARAGRERGVDVRRLEAPVQVSGHYEGLLTDAGGVLTTDIFASFDAFCAREGIGASFRELYFSSPEAQDVLYRLELGAITRQEAQRPLAVMMGLPQDRVGDLFAGLYADLRLVPE